MRFPPAGPTVQKSLSLKWILLLLVVSIISACALMSHYDPTSYKQATDLKAQSLLLISKATDPPDKHAAEIADVQLKLQQAYEYERGKGKLNAETVKQWELLNDPDAGLMGEFLKVWQAENKGQEPAYIKGMSKNVSRAFDEIIRLEKGKVKD